MKKLFIILVIILSALNSATANNPCKGTTKAGTACKRTAGPAGYCYQHNPAAAHCSGTTKAGQPCKVVVKAPGLKCYHHSVKK